MRLYKAVDYEDVSRKAANLISAQILLKPNSKIGLASGSTPIGAYRELIDMLKLQDISFEKSKILNLDEYVGLGADHPQSYHYFLHDVFVNHIDVKPENVHFIDGLAENPEKECKRYDKIIEEMDGIDLQLLGIGHNGHFAFNEPSDTMHNKTHIVGLTEETIQANKRFFEDDEEVPKTAFTVGAGCIFCAQRALMLVSGKDKAKILKKALYGPITPRVPASLLQMHPDFIVIADQEALSEIN